MPPLSRHCIWIAGLLLPLCLPGIAQAADQPENYEFFEKRIRPILVDHCYKCHSAGEKTKGGLSLDSRQGMLTGGKTRPAIVPGDPEKSLLIEAVRYTNPDLQMPPKEQLTASQVADLVAWIKQGAPDPRTQAPAAKPLSDIAAARQKWPFTPLAPPAIPHTQNKTWPKDDIDRFILARLEQAKLPPADPADKRTLIRRATFDLTGLPPTPAEVDAFLADTSPNAFAKVVDRLLASPAYGQRYARYWLDLVRYTDSFDARGSGGPKDCADAWRYRDYVVDAFNADLPYDQFIREQIAGDLLDSALNTQHSALIATTVYAIGNWGGGDADKEKLLTDIADDQIDLTGRAFLGLTLACARCHDHKFDPIPTEDYYGLAGFFFSSHILPSVGPKTDGPDMLRIPLLSKEQLTQREKIKAQIAELEKAPRTTSFALENFQPMRQPVRSLNNIPGLLSLKTATKEGTPSATFNTTNKALTFSTIKLPPRSVAIHPPPTGGVAAVFDSPITASVKISATLADADPNCGDGIEYRLIHRSSDRAAALASGTFDNGKSATLSIPTLKLSANDRIELIVLPRGEYTCDTTVITLKITPLDTAQKSYDLVPEILADPFATNAPWHFDHIVPNAKIAALQAELAKPFPSVNGLQEGGCPGSPQAGFHDVRIHIRGRYDRLGPLVPRHFPKLIAGDNQPTIISGSGRLQLADWVASPTNPLTARVMANRLWQWHFGEGIVRTPNNFGKLGTPPTHPELLDYLATQFIKNGWSINAMHRQIMLSATYQQASSPGHSELARPEPVEGSTQHSTPDPDNLLFSRMNRRRLDAEGIRDTMLAVTSELDPTPNGPAVKDLSSPRRTLYLMTIRSDRTGYRMLFDAADPTAIIDRRIDSTVAPQALFLMNHPFVLARAKKLAAEAASTQRTNTSDQVAWLYARIFSRPPTPEEIQLATTYITRHPANGLEQYCHALLCSNEFIYVD